MFILLWVSPISTYMIMELNWVTIRFLVTTLTKALLHQFGQEDSSKKNPGCFKLLPLWIMETTWFCETSMKQKLFSELFPRCVIRCNHVSEQYRRFVWPQGLVFALICIISCWTFYFQIIPIQLNLPQVTFTQSLVTPTSNMNAPELNFNCPR